MDKPRKPRKNAGADEWDRYYDRLKEWQDARQASRRSTAFRTRTRTDGSGKTDVFFNRSGDGAAHGHVVERRSEDGDVAYGYARDEDGNVYIDE